MRWATCGTTSKGLSLSLSDRRWLADRHMESTKDEDKDIFAQARHARNTIGFR